MKTVLVLLIPCLLSSTALARPDFAITTEPGVGDLPETLPDQTKFSDLTSIERNQLTSAYLAISPWSGTYWPLYMGGIAQRYADLWFPFSKDFKSNFDYLTNTMGQPATEFLSPAEKYDLLIGDNEHALTRAMLSSGSYYYQKYGFVGTWMGICQGWAAASFMVPRPSRIVTLIAANGVTRIPFYPSDIKALASLLWARTPYPRRFAGNRCEDSYPGFDENQRIINPECLDTNPATFHLALVNQIGVSKRSFVMDVVYDAEVWNQPVFGYRYAYFNPQTGVSGGTLADSKVSRINFTNDRFRKNRSTRTSSIVGILAEVTYLYETEPRHRATDSHIEDTRVTARYIYDLELDERDQIIGGEWNQLAHPDFLWTPTRDARPLSIGDPKLAEANWNTSEPFPTAWIAPAKEAAAHGQPLARVIETLTRLAAP